MGYIEETGAAQFLRDVRVTAIYEGTNGIQAMDVVNRKLGDGSEAYWLLDRVNETAGRARARLPDIAQDLWEAAEQLRETTEWLVEQTSEDRNAGAVPYLRAFARVLGGLYHQRSALTDDGGGSHTDLATFYIRRLLPEHAALCAQVRAGAEGLFRLTPEDLAAA
jgi:hypothetical protein